jgi:4a-hydroxytetrahydrobiopterin dehydratase
MAKALDQGAIETELETLEGWTLVDEKLHKSFEFDDFVSAFGFLAKIALHAERANHHPEIRNVYNEVTIDLTTHGAGGISDLDVRMARTVDGL